MKKIVSSILMTSLLAGSICACAPKTQETETPVVTTYGEPVKFEIKELSADDQDQFRKAYLNTSFDLLKTQFKNDQNVMISPASIMIALSMAEAGARGTTKDQMATLWGGQQDPGAQISYAAELVKRLNEAQGIKLNVADSMWINKENMSGFIKEEFVDFVKEHFDAEASELLFDNAALEKINSWVNEKTDGMIDKIIDRFTDEASLILINAISFDGKWSKQYEESQVAEEDFTNAAGEKQKAQMLYGMEHTYLENDKAKGFVKYYEGGQYAFVVMLPKDEAESADKMLAGFTGDDFDEYMNSSSDTAVRTSLPEFKYDYGNSLVDALKNLGMTDAFDAGKCDFTGIAEYEDGRKVVINDVIHKTHIEVDRNGTKAAAVTAVMMETAGAVAIDEVKEVYCNRPFAYAIVDMTDNTPVFLGTVNNI